MCFGLLESQHFSDSGLVNSLSNGGPGVRPDKTAFTAAHYSFESTKFLSKAQENRFTLTVQDTTVSQIRVNVTRHELGCLLSNFKASVVFCLVRFVVSYFVY